MAIDKTQSQWLYRFTAGEIPLPRDLQPKEGSVEAIMQQLALRQAREQVDEQALKEMLIGKAIAAIEPEKERIREACDLIAKIQDKSGKKKTLNVRDKEGRQERAFDSAEAPQLTETPKGKKSAKLTRDDSTPEEITSIDDLVFKKDDVVTPTTATKYYSLLVNEKDKLAAVTVERSFFDEKRKFIASRREPLFTNDEIMNELYTPLVRELVIPETFIDNRFSATQKMIDGSNEYYIKECREKGKKMGSGLAGLAKGSVQLAASITTTVLSSMAPVKDGEQALSSSGKLGKTAVATATDITNGLAALLTGAIDVVDQLDDFRNSGDFSVSGYKLVMNNLATGIGKLVGGFTGNMNFGLAVTDAITAGVTASAIAAEFYVWRKKGGDPPVSAIIDSIGGCIAAGFSVKSDLTSDSSTSTAWAQAGSGVGAAFSAAAKAAEKRLDQALRKGDWAAVFEVLAAAGNNAAKAVPVCVRYAAEYNAQTTYEDQQKLLKITGDLTNSIDQLGSATTTLSVKAVGELAKKFGVNPQTDLGKQIELIESTFKERDEEAKLKKEKEDAEQLENIQKQLEAEKKSYQDSLSCLGSKEPSDSDYKSIANLLAQMERDRAIWNAVNTMFGAGAGIGVSVATSVAAEAVPGLKAAGQLVKFIANIKAAADRLEALLKWKEACKDAESAVSPYATSIDNFISNQGEQFSHYSLQAAANAIQALLAAGEMSPYAPAFKVAGAAVGAAAAAEELVYKFYKQVALRRAWHDTKEALDPKNRNNRKMALLVRQINPTLAKYTIAYGALIEKSPIAITAMNRIGLDRETLTRAGDLVRDVKNYLEKLYNDDNIVVGVLDSTPGKTKVPAPALKSKNWTLSYLLWTENNGLATANPPAIVGNLAIAEKLLETDRKNLKPEELDQLLMVLAKLESGFLSFTPKTDMNVLLEDVKTVAGTYADLAGAAATALRMDRDSAN